MPIFIAPVVPSNITRPKRVAKQLHEIYPRQPLSACQATTAHLYGHKDWHALEEAIKSRIRSAPFDEDLASGDMGIRRQAQFDLVCLELGGVDPETDHRPPADPPHKPTMTEAELGAYAMARQSQKFQRLQKAAERWNIFLAQEAVWEVRPTAAKAPGKQHYVDGLTLYAADQLAGLPTTLGRWWRHNLPHQPVVAEALETYKLDPHRPVSLIKFAGYWGELCFHYAETIDWMMAIGTTYLIVERYGSICIQDSQELAELIAAENRNAPVAIQDQLAQAVHHLLLESMQRFFDSFPRDDFAEVFANQPSSFKANATDVIKILEAPQSKQGTWKNNQ